METLLWTLAFPLIWVGLWFTITRMGKRALSRYRSEPAEPLEEWAEYKRLAAEVRKRKDAERDDWQKEFQALLQATCKQHDYDGEHYRDWYKCKHCGYEQPWQYYSMCSCTTAEDYGITSLVRTNVLLRRSGNCVHHGRDSAKKAAAEGLRVYSKGGYTL